MAIPFARQRPAGGRPGHGAPCNLAIWAICEIQGIRTVHEIQGIPEIWEALEIRKIWDPLDAKIDEIHQK